MLDFYIENQKKFTHKIYKFIKWNAIEMNNPVVEPKK